MADYSGTFGYAAGKANAPACLDQGFREWDGQTYGTEPHPRCAGCPQIIAHASIGRHFCNQNVAVNPLADAHKFPRRLIREVQNYLEAQRWYLNGNPSDNPDYQLNGIELNNFSSWYTWEIIGVSGNTLVLKVGDSLIDPRKTISYFRQIPDPENPTGLIQIQYWASWCMPGDVLDIGGNSVLSGRISSRITGVDFSGMGSGEVSANSTWTITIESTAASVMTRANPVDNGVPLATIYRKAYHPHLWLPLEDRGEPFYCQERILNVDCTAWVDELGTFTPPAVIELPDASGNSARIAYPLGERENGSNCTATFKAEILRQGQEAYEEFNWRGRVSCDGTNSRFWPGATGPTGNQLSNSIPIDTIALRLTYYPKISDPTANGSISYHLNRCKHSLLMPNGVSTASIAGVQGGRYCDLRESVPQSLIQAFNGNCWLLGLCPYFEPALEAQLSPDHLKQIWGLTGDFQRQRIAGQDEMYIETGGGGGLLFLAGANLFLNPAGFFPTVQYTDSKKFGWFDVWTDDEGSEHINFSFGAIWNENYGYAGAEFPGGITDDMKGLFPRKCTLASKSQLSDESAHATESKAEWWPDVQASPPVAKDPENYGDGIQSGSGRDMIQRFNKTKRIFIPNLDLRQKGLPQGDWHTFTAFQSPLQIGGVNYIGLVQLKADGAQSFGTKYSGTVRRCVYGASGNWIIEANLHPYSMGDPSTSNQEDYIHTFYGSGGGIALPDPFRIIGHYQADGDSRLNPPNAKAMRGDVLTFTSILPGLKFWIARATPGVGEDLAADPEYGGFPNSRDYPPSDLAHLKRCDQYELFDEHDVLAGAAANLAGAQFTIDTDGIIHPESSFAIWLAEKGSSAFQDINGCYILKAAGQILIPEGAFSSIQGNFACLQIYCDPGIANRTREAPAEICQSLIEACSALDTVQGPGLVVNGGTVGFSGRCYIGGTNYYCIYVPPPPSTGESWWVPSGADHGNFSSTVYYQEISPNHVDYEGAYGSPGPAEMYIGVRSLIGEDGGTVYVSMPILDLAFQDILKRLPTGTEILDAKMEIRLNEDTLISKVERYFAISSTWVLNRYMWECYFDSSHLPNLVETNETTMPFSLALMGRKNDGTWDVLGTFGAGTAEVGKTHVINCADLIQQLLELRDSPYVQIHVTIASDDAPNPLLIPGQTQQLAVLESLLKGWEKVEVLSTEGTDTEKIIHGKCTSREISGTMPILRAPVIQYRLPDGAIQSLKIQRNYPSWA